MTEITNAATAALAKYQYDPFDIKKRRALFSQSGLFGAANQNTKTVNIEANEKAIGRQILDDILGAKLSGDALSNAIIYYTIEQSFDTFDLCVHLLHVHRETIRPLMKCPCSSSSSADCMLTFTCESFQVTADKDLDPNAIQEKFENVLMNE